MADEFHSDYLSQEFANTLGQTLRSMLPKEKFGYVIVVQPNDQPTERLAISNMTPEDADNLMRITVEDDNGPARPIPRVS